MKPVSRTARISAAAVAVSVTFALVWAMANQGYPGSPDARIELAASPQPTSKYIDVR